ncbi:hypothetical protein [Nocardia sp. NPDC004711]
MTTATKTVARSQSGRRCPHTCVTGSSPTSTPPRSSWPRSFEADEFIPSVRDVPLTFRTDGVWIWSGAVSHYLRKHAFPPDPELVSHIIARDFQFREVSPEEKNLAVRVITTG